MARAHQSSTSALPALKELFPEYLNPASSPSPHHSPPMSSPQATVYRSPVFSTPYPQHIPYTHTYAMSTSSHHSAHPYPNPHAYSSPHSHNERAVYSPNAFGNREPDDDLVDDGSDPEATGTNEKRRHACPSCGKRFNRPSSLKIHLNTHTGAKPFDCPYPGCGRAFNVSSNMRRHLRNHTKRPSQPQNTIPNSYPSDSGPKRNTPPPAGDIVEPQRKRSAVSAQQPWSTRDPHRYPYQLPPSPSPSPPTPLYANGPPSPHAAIPANGERYGERTGNGGVDSQRHEHEDWDGVDNGSDDGSGEGSGSGWSSSGHTMVSSHPHPQIPQTALSCTRSTSASSTSTYTSTYLKQQPSPITPSLRPIYPVAYSSSRESDDRVVSRKGHRRGSSSTSSVVAKFGAASFGISTSPKVATTTFRESDPSYAGIPPDQFPVYTFPPPPVPITVSSTSKDGNVRVYSSRHGQTVPRTVRT